MNRDKVEKLIQTLRTYPEFYDQGCWGFRKEIYNGHKRGPNSGHKCGTRACLAGYTVMMEGYSLLFEGDSKTTEVCHKGKERYQISVLAESILGLSPDDSSILFTGDATDWRHEAEFTECAVGREVDVAVMELEDLLLYGPYEKKIDPDEAETEAEPPEEPNEEPEPVSEPAAPPDETKPDEAAIVVA